MGITIHDEASGMKTTLGCEFPRLYFLGYPSYFIIFLVIQLPPRHYLVYHGVAFSQVLFLTSLSSQTILKFHNLVRFLSKFLMTILSMGRIINHRCTLELCRNVRTGLRKVIIQFRLSVWIYYCDMIVWPGAFTSNRRLKRL